MENISATSDQPAIPSKPAKALPDATWFPALGLGLLLSALSWLLLPFNPGFHATLCYACLLGYANRRLFPLQSLLAVPWLFLVLAMFEATALKQPGENFNYFWDMLVALPLLLAVANVRESAVGGAFFVAAAIVSIGFLVFQQIAAPEYLASLASHVGLHLLVPLGVGIVLGYWLRGFVTQFDPLFKSPDIERILPKQFSLGAIIAAVTAAGVLLWLAIAAQPSLRMAVEWCGAVAIGLSAGVFVVKAFEMHDHVRYSMAELRSFVDREPPLKRCAECGREANTLTTFCPYCKASYPPGAEVEEDDAETEWTP
ncbi:MAG TPA: hypothetical protein VFE24_18310 [Pirellulales bacterium]|jgi:hypothetical protein|nr:hypothetical protein [Pirellulales bacterium]